MDNKKLHQRLYQVENWLDEFAIGFLSFGTIVVIIWAVFFSATNVNMNTLGDLIFPWVTMLSLMIIGRELWLMNWHHEKIAAKGEQQ